MQRKHLIKALQGLSLVLVFILTSCLSMAAAGDLQLQQSPLNPAFVDYMKATVGKYQASSLTGDEAYQDGYIPAPVAITSRANAGKVSAQSILPEYYDLRTKGKVSPVRNQKQRGACWAFSAYAAIESALLPAEPYDFSELNMANNHGFDAKQGGNDWMSMAYLARWEGTVLEADDPYENGQNFYSPFNLKSQKHVQEVLILPEKDRQAIKEAIMQYGAVGTAIHVDYDYLNDDTYTYYYNGEEMVDHAINIVGWDDHFPKQYFIQEPERDGAWICRNSWSDGWGEDGYFYISYEDTHVNGYDDGSYEPSEVVVYSGLENTDNYDHIYQYDPLGCTKRYGFEDETGWFANVFSAAHDNETLDAVSFYTLGYDSEYEIYVNSNFEAGEGFAHLEKVASGTIEMAGYHTVQLMEPISLLKNNEFAIVVKLTTPGTECPVAFEAPVYVAGDVEETFYSSAARANSGESYISADGSTWQDVAQSFPNENVCLKAFTSSSDIAPDDSEADGFYQEGRILYSQGHYEEARAEFDQALNLNPAEAMYYFYKGECLYRLGDTEAAFACYEQAITVDEVHREMFYRVEGEHLYELERYEEALAAYNQVLGLKGESAAGWLGKANSCYKLERYEETVTAYQKAIATVPPSYQDYKQLAYALKQLERYEEAVANYDKSLEINSWGVSCSVPKSDCLLHLGRYEDALAAVDEGFAIYQKWVEASAEETVKEYAAPLYKNKGLALIELGREGEALKAVHESLALDPNDAETTAACEIINDTLDTKYHLLSTEAPMVVAPDKQFIIRFSQRIDFENLNADEIFVVDEGGEWVAVKCVFHDGGRAIKVIPESSYTSGKAYKLFVNCHVQSLNGVKLEQAVCRSFVVVDDPLS